MKLIFNYYLSKNPLLIIYLKELIREILERKKI